VEDGHASAERLFSLRRLLAALSGGDEG
jgi:hypothetical protein